MSFFISSAVAAEGAAPGAAGDTTSMFIMLAVFGVIFFFMILRPQQKRDKEHKNLMESISKGDEVLTTGGLIGRVTKISETGYLSIALNENNEVIIKREFIAAVLPKGTMKAL
jgi:preprotein translocase subunit YajC